AHLAGANAERHAVADKNNSVGLDVLGNLPGKHEVLHLLRRGSQCGHHFERILRDLVVVGILYKPAAAYPFDIKGVVRVTLWNLKYANVLFGCENSQGLIRVGRGQQDFNELSANGLGSGFVDRTVKSDDAAKRRSRVGLECLLVGVKGLSPTATPQG